MKIGSLVLFIDTKQELVSLRFCILKGRLRFAEPNANFVFAFETKQPSGAVEGWLIWIADDWRDDSDGYIERSARMIIIVILTSTEGAL